MRVVRVDARALRSLSDKEPAESWMVRLSQAGILVPEATPEPGSPQSEMDGIYQRAMALCDLEDEIKRTRYSAARTYLVPLASVLFLIAIYILSIGFASQAEDDVDRLWRFGWVWIILGILAAGVILGLRQGAQLRERERKQHFAHAKALAQTTRAEILEHRDRFMARSFAAVVKARLLVQLPDQDWLERALREVPPEHSELRADIQAEMARIDARVEELATSPPDSWTDSGLTADTAQWALRLREAGIARIPTQGL